MILIIKSLSLMAQEMDYAFNDILSKDIEELINIKVETVSSASKVEEKIYQAPGTVTVFNRYQIEAFGCRTLADILSLIRGIYITYDYNYHYAGIRGLYKVGDYDSRILLLIDGHHINDNIFDQAFIGTDFILDVDLIDRVEVIRGPLSSLYGGNAVFGIINIITRNIESQEFSISYGSNDTYKMRTTFSHKSDETINFMASATYYTSLGVDLYFKELEARGYGDGRNYIGDYDRYPSFFAKAIAGELIVFGGYIGRTKGIPTGAWDTIYNDKRNRSIDKRGFFEIKYDKELTKGYNLMLRGYYDSYEYEGYYIYLDDTQREIDRGSLVGSEVKFGIDRSGYKLNIGFEFKDNFMQNMFVYDEIDGDIMNLKHSSISAGTYLGFIYNLTDTLRLNLSTRYDYFEFYNDALSSRVSLSYNVTEKSVVKLIGGNSYRPPNIFEMYYNDGSLTQKSPEHLDPEMLYQGEAIFIHRFYDDFSLELSFFYSIIDNLIGLEIDPFDNLIVAKNVESTEITGVESRLVYSTPQGEMVSLNYDYSYSLQDIQNSFPDHMVKFRAAYPVYKGKFIPALSVNFMSGVRTISANTLDSVLLCNLNMIYRGILDHFDFSFGIYNLLNQTYYVPASVEHDMDAIIQDGISFWIKLGGKL